MKESYIMLCVFSTLRHEQAEGSDVVPLCFRPRWNEYRTEAGMMPETVRGAHTNDAPIAYVAKSLASGGKRLDRIYSLVSPEGRAEKAGCVHLADAPDTTYPSDFALWKAFIKESLPELAETDIVPIALETAGASKADGMLRSITDFATQLRQVYTRKKERRHIHLFVDITGGYRPAPIILMSIVQLMKYEGIALEEMVYSEYSRKGPGHIYSIRSIAGLQTLTAGADAFVKYGSSDAIEEFFDYHREAPAEGGRPLSAELCAVLDAMRGFSDAVQMCQAAKFSSGLDELGEALRRFERKQAPDDDDRIFAQIVNIIETGYGDILELRPETDRYLHIIRWCKEKNLLQQTMTLCTEWMPLILLAREICCPTDRQAAAEARSNLHPEWRTAFFYDHHQYYTAYVEHWKARHLAAGTAGGRPAGDAWMDLVERAKAQPPDPAMYQDHEQAEVITRILRGAHRIYNFRTVDLMMADDDCRYVLEFFCQERKRTLDSYRTEHVKTVKSLVFQFLEKKHNACRSLFESGEEGAANPLQGLPGGHGIGRHIACFRFYYRAGLIRSKLSEEDLLACVEAVFRLKDCRNQINHATGYNTSSREEILGLVDTCLREIEKA